METIEQPSSLPQPMLKRSDLRIDRSVAAKQIALDSLDDGDLLLIQTANSVYSFSVADAEARHGLLMGGQLGESCAPALLMGSQDAGPGAAEVNRSQLVAGSPAVFVVASNGVSTRLATSTVKSLTHIKAAFDQSRTPRGNNPQP